MTELIVKQTVRVPLRSGDTLTLVEGECITLLQGRTKREGFFLGNRRGEYLTHVTQEQVRLLSGKNKKKKVRS